LNTMELIFVEFVPVFLIASIFLQNHLTILRREGKTTSPWSAFNSNISRKVTDRWRGITTTSTSTLKSPLLETDISWTETTVSSYFTNSRKPSAYVTPAPLPPVQSENGSDRKLT